MPGLRSERHVEAMFPVRVRCEGPHRRPVLAWRSRFALALAVACGACGGGGDERSATQPVVPNVYSVEVTPPAAILELGATLALAATAKASNGATLSRTCAWSSSDSARVSVSDAGVITGVAVGENITVSASVDGKSGFALIAVRPPPVRSVSVSLASDTLQVGESTSATARLTDASGRVLTDRSITWSTSNPTVAAVSAAGVVSALAVGQAQVVATSEGMSGAVTVGVLAPLPACLADARLDAWCRLTDSPTDQTFPSVSGTRVVWADRRFGVDGQVIMMLDLATGQTTTLTPLGEESLLPTIDGGRVIYARLPRAGDWQLLTYDLNTGREAQFSSVSRDVGLGRLALSGNRAAWHTYRDNNWDIYVFDFATNQETRLTSDPAEQADPAIDGDRVTWSDRRHGATWWDLYLYDLRTRTATRITQGSTLGRSAALSSDRIVWGDIRGSLFTLFEYTFAGGGTQRSLNAGPIENGIVTAGSAVAWHDRSYDIFAFDIATGRQVQVTRLPSRQWLPQMSADYLVWADFRNGNSDIYIARLADVFKP